MILEHCNADLTLEDRIVDFAVELSHDVGLTIHEVMGVMQAVTARSLVELAGE